MGVGVTMEDPGAAWLAPSIETTMTCPSCGQTVPVPRAASADEVIRVLLAVCDVLVIKVMERVGIYILRLEKRDRFSKLDALGLPFHLAHTVWPLRGPFGDEIISKGIRGAWDVVPLILDTHGPEFDARRAVEVLDEYVHDLVVSGTPHDINVMAFRLRTGLGLPVLHVHSAA